MILLLLWEEFKVEDEVKVPVIEPENLTKTLADRVEELVWQLDISYMDAVIQLAEELDMEVEAVALHVARNVEIYRAIRSEAEALNFIEKEIRLEF